MFLVFAIRHFCRHWSMNLVLLLALTLSTTVLSLLPTYLTSIGAAQLAQSLSSAHALARNLELDGDQLGSNEDVLLEATFGPLLQERIEIRQAALDAGQLMRIHGTASQASERLVLHLWSFENLSDHVQILDGSLPGLPETASTSLPVVVGVRAAEDLGLHPGDVLNDLEGSFDFTIVGTVTPLDPQADVWWHDRTLRPFRPWRQSDPFGTDTIYLSLLVDPAVMRGLEIEQRIHWRVLLNWSKISIDRTRELHRTLTDLERQLGARFVDLETGLPELLEGFHEKLDIAQVFLVLLAAQSLLAVLYVLVTIGSFLLEGSQVELAAMTGRGFSGAHVAGLFAVQAAVLAFGVALPVGPLLARGAAALWAGANGHPFPPLIPAASWALALAAALCGWLALVVPLYANTRQNLLDWQRQQGRPALRARWQRLVLDLAMLGVGTLTYWQLTQGSGAAWQVDETFIAADPVLLIGPSVLFLAIALLLLRLFPVLLNLSRRVTHRARRLVPSFALTKLARLPREPNQMILLISLAAGLLLFSTVLSDSIAQRQREIAQYTSGADLRVTLPLETREAQANSTRISQIPGIQAAALAYRNSVLVDRGTSASIELLAASPSTLPQVTRFAPGVSERTAADVLSELAWSPGQDMPLLASPGALPSGTKVGDTAHYRMCGRTLTFLVRGITPHWPTLGPPFVLTDLSALEASGGVTCGQRELWVAVEEEEYKEVLHQVGVLAKETSGRVEVVADARRQLRAFEADLVAQTVTAAFRLNAVTLVILSSTSFLLLQILALRRRLPQLSILRALGMSMRQRRRLISLEGAVVVALGLGIGAGTGLILTHAMRAFLAFALAPSLGAYATNRFVFAWDHIARTILPLVGIDVLSTWCLVAALQRADLHHALRAVNE